MRSTNSFTLIKLLIVTPQRNLLRSFQRGRRAPSQSNRISTGSVSSFTLIELLIVIGILAILVAAVVVVLNPAQLVAQARDSKRQQDLSALAHALNTITALDQTTFFGTSSIVYTSLPDSTSSCASWSLPTLPSGWSYHCVATSSLQNTDGTGWIPVNIKANGVINLSALPTDPQNTSSTGLYYTYVTGGSFELNGILESTKYRTNTSLAAPNLPGVLAYGSNLTLSPIYTTSGLVGYWPFDEGSGTVAKDMSGNNNNGTLYNGPTWTGGKVGGALSFNGSGNYADLGNSSSLNFSNGFSAGAWIQGGNYSPWDPFLGKESWNAGLGFVILVGDSAGGVTYYGGTGVGSMSAISFANAAPMGAWTHVLVTNSSGTAKMYVNGALAASGSIPITNAPDDLLVAARHTNDGGAASDWFGGRVDDVRVYNRALSASEVSALYNATK